MAKKNKNLLRFQGTGAQAGILGRYAIQQALASGLSRQDIRKAAERQGLQINPKGRELLAASKQTGKGIQLSQFQGADAQSNILGGYAVQQARSRGLSKKQIRDLAKSQGYTINKKGLAALQEAGGGGIKQAVRAAGQNRVISKQEMKDIIDKSGGNVAKALERISTVQQSIKKSGKKAPSLGSGAANMLIKQAAASPGRFGLPSTLLGNSKLGQMLQQRVGSPGSPGARIKGHLVGQQPAVPMQLMVGGTVLRPGGRIAVRPQKPTIVNQPFDPSALEQQIAELTNLVNAGNTTTLGDDTTTLGGDDTTLGNDDIMTFLGDLINQPVGTPQFLDYGDLSGFGGGGTQYNMGGGFDMTPLTNMFANQPVLQSDAAMEQALQEMDITDPIQLAALGKSYATNIKGSPRASKPRAMYRRNDMAIQPTPAARKLVGGLTL